MASTKYSQPSEDRLRDMEKLIEEIHELLQKGRVEYGFWRDGKWILNTDGLAISGSYSQLAATQESAKTDKYMAYIAEYEIRPLPQPQE